MAIRRGNQKAVGTARNPYAPPPPAAAAPRRRPFLEIQYHPGDIRRGVRYLFLSRRQVFWWIVGGVAYLAFLISSLAITPTVVANRLSQRQYRELLEERSHEGERLRQLVDRLSELEVETGQALTDMAKIHLAYGLPDESRGKGGYPQPPSTPPVSETRSIYRQDIERGYQLRARSLGRMEALDVFFEEVQAFEEANRDQVQTTPSLSPLRPETFVMTSPFGTRRSPFTKEIDFHAGIDLAATKGTPVYAPADGVVAFAGRIPLSQSVGWWRYGNLVAIQHSASLMTLYGHCEEILLVDERKRTKKEVQRGEVIATVGDTGWSTNPHLHYEVRWRDEEGKWVPVDPRIYILDHRWRDEERMLIQARRAPSSDDYEPLPRVIGR